MFHIIYKARPDVALEALHKGLRSRHCSVDETLDFARINQVEKVLLHNMEAMLGP